MTSRPLTPAEVTLARTIYHDAIDYAPVRLHRRRWMPFQPRDTVMSPDGHLWFHPSSTAWSEDFATARLGLQALFIHELTHVWQHQRGVYLPLARHPFCRYHYRLTPGWPLARYGLEQQAEIVRHTFLLRHGSPVPGAPPLAQYESVLGFATA